MFLVKARPHEIDDGDVVARLTSRTESMTEHEPEGSFVHCFVGLLKASLFIESENFVSRGELLVRAREETVDLCRVSNMAFAGEFTPVLAKHSKSFSLIDCISVGVDRMQRNFEPMRKQVEKWQRSELTDVTAKVVIYEAFVESKLEAPKPLARA